MIVKGKTKSGFPFQIDSDKLLSWKFAKAMRDSENKKNGGKQVSGYVTMVEILLGDTQALEDHLGGDPSIEQISEEIGEMILKVRDEIKNSQSLSQ